MPELDQSQLDFIAEEFARAIRAGENPSIDQFVAKHDGASDQLRPLLASIAMIEGIKQDSNPAGDGGELAIQQLDDYKILREVGRGGMGVVFEAIHQSLGRRVAIKVLSRGVLGESRHLARFRREARAAARLRHPNIVPVFGAGDCGGHHYYVMDLIEGVSLRDWLRSVSGRKRKQLPTLDAAVASTNDDLAVADAADKPQVTGACVPPRSGTRDYFRWVALRIAAICDALQYAHAQGVLHRDIKPANLLINEAGHVWIADFGLAKLTEEHFESQAADPNADPNPNQPHDRHWVTMTGDVVGTPQYMAPESFEGEYNIQSEIYGVGLTLYELLTLQPAIEGRTTGDVIRRATAGVKTPPRSLLPELPRDLDTIVTKALAHNPRSRYRSAGELRDDLQRFLTDRPIAARRVGLTERAVRWSRREPMVATLAFSTFALLLSLASVSAVGFAISQSAKRDTETLLRQRTDALASADAARITADEQRERAEKNLQVALSAFDEIMRNITDRGIDADEEFLDEVTDTTSPDVTPEDAKLLQSLLGFFDQLADNNSEDLLAESSVAARRAGDIYQRLGRLREADGAFTEALSRYGRLAKNDPTNVEFVIAQAEIMNTLAVTTSLRGKRQRAAQLFQETVSLLKGSEQAFTSGKGQFEYARALRLFASLRARSGFNDLMPDSRTRRPVAGMLRVRAQHELDIIDRAITTLDSLVGQAPDNVRYRAELARAHRDKSRIAGQAKRTLLSEAAVSKSIELFEELLKQSPESEAIRYELATTLLTSEAFRFNQMTRARRADQLSDELLADSGTLARYRALKAHSLNTLALHYRKSDRLVAAESNLRDALRIYGSLVAQYPELRIYETRRAQTLESLADVKLDQGQQDAARDLLERGIRRLQPRRRGFGGSPVSAMQLNRMQQKLKQIE